jgi:hypothetical protein
MRTDIQKMTRADRVLNLAIRPAVLLVAAVLFASCGSAPPADTPDDTLAVNKIFSKEQRLKIYVQAIKANGYSSRILDGSVIEFRRSGLYYYVSMEDREPEFVQLVLPSFWELESKKEQEQAVKAASYASGRTKGAKVYLANEDDMDVSVATDIYLPNDVSVVADLYLPNPDEFAVHFPRMLMMIDTGAGHFEKQMMGEW